MLQKNHLSFCLSILFGIVGITQNTSAQSALKTEDLIGRWGVAAYWNEGDAAKITAQAKSFCSQPYIISKGKNGGAMMFEAFDGKAKEVVVQSGQIVAFDGSTRNTTKIIQSWNGSTLVINYTDEEAKRRYGNMVFVRCGR
jgi:negative regulator of sigma E activity